MHDYRDVYFHHRMAVDHFPHIYIQNIDAIRSDVGMVFQSFNLFPHLTAIENCTLAPMWVKKMPQAEADEIAMKYLERVKIPEQAPSGSEGSPRGPLATVPGAWRRSPDAKPANFSPCGVDTTTTRSRGPISPL